MHYEKRPRALLDILESVQRVEKYAAQGRAAFDSDELIQTWIVHHLQIIGEAARGLSDGFRDAHPQVPWRQIVGMRNILVHHYFGIDKNAVWSAVQDDLADLKSKVSTILGREFPAS